MKMSAVTDLSEISLEFMFATPLDNHHEKEFFRFFEEIASVVDTQVWIQTFKELYVGKMPEGLFVKPLAGVDEKNRWLRISKPITTQYLYSDTYVYLVTIITSNVSDVSSKLHLYFYSVLKDKGGKVLLKKDNKEMLLVPSEKQFSQEELTKIIC
jgi:hypothetical protein